MLDGPSVVQALKRCGITHVVWLPDSELGTWEAALTAPGGLIVAITSDSTMTDANSNTMSAASAIHAIAFLPLSVRSNISRDRTSV